MIDSAAEVKALMRSGSEIIEVPATLLADLCSMVERVAYLHQPVPVEKVGTVCEACSTRRGRGNEVRFFPFVPYPCPTVTALEDDPNLG